MLSTTSLKKQISISLRGAVFLAIIHASTAFADLAVNSSSTDAHGVTTYSVTSVYQGPNPTALRILTPDNPAAGKPHRFLHILPVFGGETGGFELARQLGVHNTYNMTLVAPTFHVEPWYGDHVSDPNIRQESFITEDVLPWLNDADGDASNEFTDGEHLLLGFSKSGNGVVTLTLRNPDKFVAAAAWDAPLAITSPIYGGPLVYGSEAHFDAHYNIPNLLGTHAGPFQADERLWLGAGPGNLWQGQMVAAQTLISDAGVLHEFDNTMAFGHAWNTGWIAPAVEFLDAATAGPDTAPPSITTLDPANGATNVLPGGNLVVTFSELVQKGSGDIVIQQSAGGAFETIPVTSGNVTVSGATVTIDPSIDLASGTGYYVEIANGAIKDLAAAPNDFDGISGSGTWSFTTGIPDTTAPSIITLAPFNGETDVAAGTKLVATFDEDVQEGAGDILIRELVGGAIVSTIAVTSSEVSISGASVTIDPNSALSFDTGYYVEIANGAITDLSSNPFAGISGSSAWNFTTSAVPASATTIQPVSVTGPEVDGRFLLEYLRDGTGLSGGGDILTQTHHIGTGSVGGNGDWLSANYTPTIVFDLGGTFDVDAVHLWQYTDPNSAWNPWGTKSFDLHFSTDGGNNYGPAVASGDFVIGQIGVGGEEGAQTKSFAVQAGVTHIQLTNFSNYSGSGLIGAAEIRFGVASNDFSDWIAGYSVGGQTGIGDDPDGDGVDSGVENFFGTAPDTFTQGLVSGTYDEGADTFTFTHPLGTLADDLADDLAAVYRWSTDLQDFYDDGDSNGAGTTTVDFSQGTPSGGMVTVTATISGTVIPAKLFVNVEVTQN